MGKKQKRVGGFRRVGTIATATLTPFIRRAWDSGENAADALAVEATASQLTLQNEDGIAGASAIDVTSVGIEPLAHAAIGPVLPTQVNDSDERPAKKRRTTKADDFDVTAIIPHYKRAQDVPDHLQKCECDFRTPAALF
jgi:hypothetical protein